MFCRESTLARNRRAAGRAVLAAFVSARPHVQPGDTEAGCAEPEGRAAEPCDRGHGENAKQLVALRRGRRPDEGGDMAIGRGRRELARHDQGCIADEIRKSDHIVWLPGKLLGECERIGRCVSQRRRGKQHAFERRGARIGSQRRHLPEERRHRGRRQRGDGDFAEAGIVRPCVEHVSERHRVAASAKPIRSPPSASGARTACHHIASPICRGLGAERPRHVPSSGLHAGSDA